MVKDITLSVITALKADPGVAGKVITRVYRKTLPPNPTYPAIVVSKVDDIRNIDTSTGDYSAARVQCTAFASSDGTADELSELVATALHRTVNTFLSSLYVIAIEDAGTVPDVVTDISVYLYHRDFLIQYSTR